MMPYVLSSEVVAESMLPELDTPPLETLPTFDRRLVETDAVDGFLGDVSLVETALAFSKD